MANLVGENNFNRISTPQEGIHNLSLDEKNKILNGGETSIDLNDIPTESGAVELEPNIETDHPRLLEDEEHLRRGRTERVPEPVAIIPIPPPREPTPTQPAPEIPGEEIPPQSSPEENISELQNSREWEDLKKYREYAIVSQISVGWCNKYKDSNETVEQFRERVQKDYQEVKELAANKIRETLRTSMGTGPLSPEQEAELRLRANRAASDELVEKENDLYIQTLRKERGETIIDTGIEAAKNLLSTKAFKWYLGLSRKQKMACSFAISSVFGLVGGATLAPGVLGLATYLTWKATRVLASGAVGVKAGEWANRKWSAEELQREEDEETEALRSSELSLEEKSKGFEDIQNKYKKKRLFMTLKKVGTTMAAGAGTAALTGMLEHVTTGGAAASVAESKGGKGAGIQENRLQRRGFEPVKSEQVQVKSTPPVPPAQTLGSARHSSASAEQVVSTEHPPAAITPAVETVTPPKVPEVTQVSNELFSDTSVFRREVVSGDSNWDLLKGTWQNNERFINLKPGQQTYVLSAFTKKLLDNPTEYGGGGVGPNGEIFVGKPVDFTKLFEEKDWVKSVMDKAEGLPPVKIQNIEAQDVKIADWVRENPGKPLNEKTVYEILNKPKVEESSLKVFKPDPDRWARDGKVVVPEPEVPAHPKVEIEPENSAALPKQSPEQPEAFEVAETDVIAEVENRESTPSQEQLRGEILEARQRLSVVEGGQKDVENLRTMAGDMTVDPEVQKAFVEEIDSVYGKKGLFGIGRVNGVNDKEWRFMARQPAPKIVEHYTSDSAKSDLAVDVVDRLAKSKSHDALMKQTIGLMKQSYGAIKPYENENMENFLKRLGGYVLKNHLSLNNLKKAA